MAYKCQEVWTHRPQCQISPAGVLQMKTLGMTSSSRGLMKMAASFYKYMKRPRAGLHFLVEILLLRNIYKDACNRAKAQQHHCPSRRNIKNGRLKVVAWQTWENVTYANHHNLLPHQIHMSSSFCLCSVKLVGFKTGD